MTLHALSFNNLKSDGYLRCLADVLPWLIFLSSTDWCQFDYQLFEHEYLKPKKKPGICRAFVLRRF